MVQPFIKSALIHNMLPRLGTFNVQVQHNSMNVVMEQFAVCLVPQQEGMFYTTQRVHLMVINDVIADDGANK